MILKLSLDFNPETKKVKVLSVETDEVSTPETPQVPESQEPQIVLGTSNYTLNKAAAGLLGVSPDSRIGLNYTTVNGKELPVIGAEEAFGCSCGNKLSKSLTVSYRGKQLERLARFGNVFTLSSLEGSEGLFIMKGNVAPAQIPDDIEIVEDMTVHEDNPSVTEESSEPTFILESSSESNRELEPLTFDDDFDFDINESKDTLISEDSISFE